MTFRSKSSALSALVLWAAALHSIPAAAAGELYMAAGGVGSATYLYSIDPGTGSLSGVNYVGGGGSLFTGATTGMAYGGGELYMTAGAAGSATYLYRIDPGTGSLGAVNYVGGAGGLFTGATTGLAYVTSVPEPGTFALLGIGLALFGAMRTRASTRDGIRNHRACAEAGFTWAGAISGGSANKAAVRVMR